MDLNVFCDLYWCKPQEDGRRRRESLTVSIQGAIYSFASTNDLLYSPYEDTETFNAQKTVFVLIQLRKRAEKHL